MAADPVLPRSSGEYLVEIVEVYREWVGELCSAAPKDCPSKSPRIAMRKGAKFLCRPEAGLNEKSKSTFRRPRLSHAFLSSYIPVRRVIPSRLTRIRHKPPTVGQKIPFLPTELFRCGIASTSERGLKRRETVAGCTSEEASGIGSCFFAFGNHLNDFSLLLWSELGSPAAKKFSKVIPRDHSGQRIQCQYSFLRPTSF